MKKSKTLKGLAVGALLAFGSASTVTHAADPIRIPVLNWSSQIVMAHVWLKFSKKWVTK